MELQLLIPSVAIALVIVCGSIGVFLIAAEQSKKRVRDRLDDVINVGEGDDKARDVILRDMDLSTVPFLNRVLQGASWARRLDTLLVQGDIRLRLGTFVALMLLAGSLVTYFVGFAMHQPLLAIPAGVLAAALPVFYARRRKTKRVLKFEKQFPDALDMLTNALRAGMALPVAIQVVSEESPDPVGREFAILFEENRLGLDMKEALRKLGARIDSTELNLFVTAVIMHRETGGNLAEILEGTAAVIRDRFRILGDVRSLTAQSRLSGVILAVLPIAIAGLVLMVAPDYLRGLIDDAVGRNLLVFAVALQIVGFLAMRRIVKIKV
jgi:tight adherence protein B